MGCTFSGGGVTDQQSGRKWRKWYCGRWRAPRVLPSAFRVPPEPVVPPAKAGARTRRLIFCRGAAERSPSQDCAQAVHATVALVASRRTRGSRSDGVCPRVRARRHLHTLRPPSQCQASARQSHPPLRAALVVVATVASAAVMVATVATTDAALASPSRWTRSQLCRALVPDVWL